MDHIWSFTATNSRNIRCPCENSLVVHLLPSFVGENYFCSDAHNDGAVWDAPDCESACCTLNSPPYFITTLPAPTSDDIEVRICRDQHSGDEEVAVAQLQIFIAQ